MVRRYCAKENFWKYFYADAGKEIATRFCKEPLDLLRPGSARVTTQSALRCGRLSLEM
jgi:hypothetical protein